MRLTNNGTPVLGWTRYRIVRWGHNEWAKPTVCQEPGGWEARERLESFVGTPWCGEGVAPMLEGRIDDYRALQGQANVAFLEYE